MKHNAVSLDDPSPTCHRRGWCLISKRFFWMNHESFQTISGRAMISFLVWPILNTGYGHNWDARERVTEDLKKPVMGRGRVAAT
jgi:hypothetical protein